MSEIDTEMYLRDGAPHATVCKVLMKDGRVGIGIFRQERIAGHFNLGQVSADKAALKDALENVPAAETIHIPGVVSNQEPDTDLQASLGQKAHE